MFRWWTLPVALLVTASVIFLTGHAHAAARTTRTARTAVTNPSMGKPTLVHIRRAHN